ncbi:MAG: GumC family protein, partial [Cyclobacteriaceae bacterium]
MALSQLDDRSKNPGLAINPARVIDRLIRYWWVFVITIGIGVLTAFIINRYTTKIYPISASILMKESEDASYSRFLYGTSMLNPQRNYSDQFYIMRSYPLIQKVIENLKLHITYYLEGDIKIKEWYFPNFPIEFLPVKGSSLPYGKSFKISFIGKNRFALSLAAAGDDFDDPAEYTFSDTLNLYGSRVGFILKNSVASFTGREYIVHIEDPYEMAVRYSSALGLAWSQRGSGVIDISLSGPTPQKEEAFLYEFIEQYQEYDIVQKTSASLKSMNFLDRQVEMIEDSLKYYETLLAGYPVTENPAAAQEKLSSLASQLDENDVTIQLQEKYYAYLEQYMNTQSDFSQVLLPSSLGVSDPVLSGIIGKLAELQFELRALQGREEQAGNPLVAESKAKIEIYKRDIAEGIRSAKEIMRINRSMVSERIKEMKQRMISKPASDTRLVKLQRNYKFNENLYNFIVQKRSEAALTRASAVSDISILNNPSTGTAITPVPFQNYAYAIVIGILLPLVFFVLIEFLNNKIQSKEDIEAISTVPVIGTIGHNIIPSNLAIHE